MSDREYKELEAELKAGEEEFEQALLDLERFYGVEIDRSLIIKL